MAKQEKGKIGNRNTKLTRGIGVNDADYPIYEKNRDGKQWHCPIYRLWANMLTRVTYVEGKYVYDYSPKYGYNYEKVTVCVSGDTLVSSENG